MVLDRSLPFLPLGIACFALARLLGAFWAFTVDDAFITFRYAENLASGHGPTFNRGEPPVEGYTSFIWMLLMSIPHVLGIDGVAFAKVAGTLSILGLLVVVHRFTSWLTGPFAPAGRHLAAAASVLLLSTFPATAVHAVAGMETALFAVLLTAFLYGIVQLGESTDPRAIWRVAGIGLLVGLTRPEGNLAVVVGLSVALIRAPSALRERWLRMAGATYLLPMGIYFLWRYAYYDLPLPLAYYVKVGSQMRPRGAQEVLAFLSRVGLGAGPLVLLGLAKVVWRTLPTVAASSSIVLFFVVPDHIMGYDWRYLYPVVPFLLAVAGAGFVVLYGVLGRLRMLAGREPFTTLPSLLLALVVLAWGSGRFLWDVRSNIDAKERYAQGIRDTYAVIAKQLRSLGEGQTSAPVLAIADAGAIPYYSRWRTIDVFGLNNAAIARSGWHDPGAILSQKPDLVILTSKSLVHFVPRMPWVGELYEACREAGIVFLHACYVRSDYYPWILGDLRNPIVQEFRRRSSRQVDSGQVASIEVMCPGCGSDWHIQADLGSSYPLQLGRLPYPADETLVCFGCGNVLDLSPLRREAESQTGKHVVPQVRSLVDLLR